jgi:hypothetical protein
MSKLYYALIGDAVASRALPGPARARLQADLRATLAEINRRWRPALAARFAVTLGDEFQGLLARPDTVWDIVHHARARIPGTDWVIACGRGPLATPLPARATAPELDGPCFHEARTALVRAKDERAVLAFGGFAEPRLTALASYYSALYWSWTRRQRRAAHGWRAADEREPVEPSARSHLRRRMAWPLVEAGDMMLRQLLAAS